MGKIHEQMAFETKQKLQDAFIDIMAVHGIEGVTVRALATATGLNRGTFYLHYTDKFDLMTQIQNRLLTGLQDCLDDFEPLDGLSYIKSGKPYPAIIQMFTYFGQEATAFKVLLGPTGDPAFSQKVKTLYKETILQKVLLRISQQSNESVDLHEIKQFNNYFLSFILSAIFGVIEEWLANDTKETPEEMGFVQLNIIQMICTQLFRS